MYVIKIILLGLSKVTCFLHSPWLLVEEKSYLFGVC